jgi:hypothetical protein
VAQEIVEKATLAPLVRYDVTEAQISETRAKYSSLSADTWKGYEEVRIAIGHIRDTRVAIEKRRIDLKADALAYGRLVDSEAKRFTTLLLEIEEPLKTKKAAVDEQKAREKAFKEAEERRVIEEQLAAKRAKEEEESRAVREAEEKRLTEERAALEAERKKLEAEQAALEEQRQAAIAEARAEAARQEAAHKAEQKAQADRLAAARQVEQDRLDAAAAAERARIDAEREKLAAERRAEEERQRVEREALDTERRRVAAEREAAERADFERQAMIRAATAAAEKVERDRIEKARREADFAALRPDVEKVAAFVAQIRSLVPPKVKARAFVSMLSNAAKDLEAIAAVLDGAIARVKEKA